MWPRRGLNSDLTWGNLQCAVCHEPSTPAGTAPAVCPGLGLEGASQAPLAGLPCMQQGQAVPVGADKK